MMPVLVDTSVWVQFFRKTGGGKSSDLIVELLEEDDVCITGIVISELFSGARNEKERKLLSEILDPLRYVETTKEIWRESGECRHLLLRKGVSAPLPDIIIAATAIHYGVQLFTLDNHFSRIAEFMPLALLRH